MLAVHTILHPTDFSEQSQCALGLASALTRDYGARLIVLHVVVPPTLAYGEGAVPLDPTTFLPEARAQLDQLPMPRADVRAERRVAEGNPVEEILRVAAEMDADLIVMGTHGRTGLSRLVMGSVAEQVMRTASCPVLTVKTPFPETLPEASAQEGRLLAESI